MLRVHSSSLSAVGEPSVCQTPLSLEVKQAPDLHGFINMRRLAASRLEPHHNFGPCLCLRAIVLAYPGASSPSMMHFTSGTGIGEAEQGGSLAPQWPRRRWSRGESVTGWMEAATMNSGESSAWNERSRNRIWMVRSKSNAERKICDVAQ